MRAGFLQFEPRLGDVLFNLRTIRRVLKREKFDLMVLPELSSTGYLLGSRERAFEWAEPVPDGPTVKELIALAKEHKGYLVAGIAERDGEKLYNTAVLVGPKGLVHRHRKVHLTRNEIPIFDRGDEFRVVQVAGVKVGIAISFDIWMPEACRRLALDGAEILAIPANYGRPWTAEVAMVRALENMFFVVSANRIGVEEWNGTSATFRGGSQIIDCDGELLYRAGKEECSATAELDTTRARVKQNVLCGDWHGELERYGVRRSAAGS